MSASLVDVVALALFASDGMKFASREISLEESWERTPERHTEYRERAIVLIKVLGQQLNKMADAEIASIEFKMGG
jgi:hypothetical protein